MRLILFYAVSFLINAASAFAFRESISFTAASTLPVVLGLSSLFEGCYFKLNPSKKDFNISNSSDLTEEEWKTLSKYTSYSFFISLPIYIPFALFFGIWIKLLSIFVYLAAFAGGPLFYRIRHYDEYSSRIKREADELKEQLKKEEHGKIK